jgi:hypothetical protein
MFELLSDDQAVTVTDIASGLPAEKRVTFLERLGARLRLRDRPILLADDFDKLLRAAMQGLVQVPKLP